MLMNHLKKIKILFFIVICGLYFIVYAANEQQSKNKYVNQKNRVALITIPKCGSNLLIKTIGRMLGLKGYIGAPKWVLLDDATIKKLMTISSFLSSHLIYVPENIQRLQRNDIKKIFIYRDPRDQIVSAAFHMKKLSKSFAFSSWEIDRLIDVLILGGGPIWSALFLSKEPWLSLQSITSFYNLYLPWMLEPNTYTTTFEKLVGSKGGGSDTQQVREIVAMAHHIGLDLDLKTVKGIVDKLFGGTSTFRAGKIGSWKKYFLPRHKEAFKKVAGQLLIDLGYEKDLNW